MNIFKSCLFISLLFSSLSVFAKNIDLSTVPPRQQVQLTIYNAEDLTLVREKRTLSFKKGKNPLQFSWSNTLIDPSSVELRFLNHGAELEILDIRFPHDKPQMLYWQIHSEYQGAVELEISYFTSGISWQADYLAIANPEETTLNLESFVRIRNHSGEDYENAQVRLVVGTINLVESISSLTSRQTQIKASGRYQKKAQNKRRMKHAIRALKTEATMEMADMAVPAAMAAPKEVAKESLSEYFLYTIEGTETIADGWSKRLRSFKADAVPMQVEYRYRPREYGNQLVRLYLMKNDSASELGKTPLPEGQVQVFREKTQQGLNWLTAQHLKYVPIGDKIELNLGVDPEVQFELRKLKVWRDAFLMKLRGPNVYRKLDSGKLQFDSRSTVAGWDSHTRYSQQVINYTQRPIQLEVRRQYEGDVLFRSDLKPTLHDFRTVQYQAHIPVGQKQELTYEVVLRQGKNAHKNNVTLETLK
ncbi:DUF4139 domain-containing protein [Candidatus Venteria ishoeyi]|uniref:DUF4139 domain-containing protein n=1 Tax=Candidatus Venteria ishoeyi TaxID=1899563 RepID=A0A1H6FFW4_9GAMM|nr:DUF4139 domain-containing protein [Candidatus Venteria ishoeyi]MDM8546604.1 DUF4139 domain-containing protein [Candidatus Venteria ishoeyi]SEH08927.1 Uncharacterised protein [Candidatus Venteria ishoeyi]